MHDVILARTQTLEMIFNHQYSYNFANMSSLSRIFLSNLKTNESYGRRMLLGRIHEAWKKQTDSWTIHFQLQLSEDIFWEHLLREDIAGT